MKLCGICLGRRLCALGGLQQPSVASCPLNGTQVAAMVCYDVMLAPQQAQSSKSMAGGRPGPLRRQASKGGLPYAIGANPLVMRIALMVAAVLAYVRTRSWLAGDHLVRIYRKVRHCCLSHTLLRPNAYRTGNSAAEPKQSSGQDRFQC